MIAPLRPEVQSFLSPRLGAMPSPVRAVLFGLEGFHQHGMSLAEAQPVERRRDWRRRVRAPHFFPRLEANVRSLAQARRYLERLDGEGQTLSPAAEWLLENFHLIEAQLPEVRTGMPRTYYAQLPRLRQAPLAGLPRVYGIAWAFVAHTDSSFDAGLLSRFLQGYQTVDVLTLGELWALPATLRVVLMENLARLADSVATTKAAIEAANWWADHAARLRLDRLRDLHRRARARGVEAAFLAQLAQRRRADAASEERPWHQWLDEAAPDSAACLGVAQAAQAADNVSVSNAVTALRRIDNLEWMELVRSLSPVLQTLGGLPAFNADSELTRDAVTHEVERLARDHRRTETQVADQVVALCRAGADAPERCPAHWTLGAGRQALHAALGGPEPPAWRAPERLVRRWRTRLYGTGLCVGTAGVLWWLWPSAAASTTAAALGTALMALPTLECVVAIMHRMLAEAVRVQRLPRLALEEGLDPELATLVAVPCLLSSADGVDRLLQRLELHHLANTDPHAHFALLSDWADADLPHLPEDEALLARARDGVVRLNACHAAPAQAPRFLLLHRPRRWSASERVWMGWERKRGKIDQLLAVIADGMASPFMDLGAPSRLPPSLRYLVVLDSDTELPPDSLRSMVAIAAHPLNRPTIDEASRRVTRGYGILQPRVGSAFPPPGGITTFGWIFSGPWGTDAYNGGCSEVYQDVFGEGSFYGKGLFDVQAVHAVLHGRVQPGRLLSHDLFEGLWARCAYLSDVTVLEPHPMHPDVAAARSHRWTRGDWQLLGFLGALVEGGVGALNVWKVLDNLRRSLLAPASVALLWWVFVTGAVAPGLAVALVAGAHGLGPLVGALAGAVPGRRRLAWRHWARESGIELARASAGVLWHAALLMHSATLHADAIVRALWRMAVSRRRLLEWTTTAQAEAAVRHDWGGFWRRHGRTPLVAAAWAAAGLWVPGAQTGWLLAAAVLWMLTPAVLWAAARPWPRRSTPLAGAAEHAYVTKLARDTWSYFERHVTEEDHDLPPDNLQIEPQEMVAHRTSPTNIGLYLVGALCAWRLGFTPLDDLGRRIDRTLGTLARLPRHRGHLFNWTDTRGLQALPPHYVSTVDSGNLAACLWTLAQFCRETAQAEDDPPAAEAWQERARQADAMVAQMDFRFLYDPRRRLLHIGYRLDDATLDPAYYDLLASEARLTSFVAIAKGDVPRRHWEALGRPFLSRHGAPVLRSWSGSMFEYLMPGLLIDEPAGGLLRRVAVAAVGAQRRFGDRHGVPWGVSESGYFAQDHTLAFQYGPFGVHDLALRRTPAEDRVIAPYATALAMGIDAGAALRNLRRLEALQGRGPHGFIEALDFTPQRGGLAASPQRVAAFMAHHQGMSLVAFANVLCDGAVRAWFCRAPRAMAHLSLVHERMPREIVPHEPTLPRLPHAAAAEPGMAIVREFLPHEAPAWRPTQWLSNGRYGVSLRPHGAGSSTWRGRAITRFRDDALRDGYGTWLMARPAGEPAFHSLTCAPHPWPHARYGARFFNDHVEFSVATDAFEAQVSVWVAADDDIEFRLVTVHNLRDEPLDLELLSFLEIAMATQAADEAHPAFSSLFVQAHAADPKGMLLERRPRTAGEPGWWVAHFVGACDVALQDVRLCASRERLLPRRAGMGQVRAGSSPQDADGRMDTDLDPAASIVVRLSLPPHSRGSVSFATAAADDRATLLALMDEYRQEVHVQSARAMAAALARIRHRELGIDAADLHAVQDLATLVTMSVGWPRAAEVGDADRRTLWRFGISGDRPLLVAHASAVQALGAIRVLMAAQRLWEFAGLATDLVVVNGEPPSYLMPLQNQLTSLRGHLGTGQADQPQRSAVHVLRDNELTAAERTALSAQARIDMLADGRPLAKLLAHLLPHIPLAWGTARRATTALAPDAPWAAPDRDHRFEDRGRVFCIELEEGRSTPRPWVNVIANPTFGCLVSESGGGFTWARNSRLNQLTPWSNDALRDPPAEHWVVIDEASGATVGALPTLAGRGQGRWQVRHGQGASEFRHRRAGLDICTVVAVDPQASVKCVRIRLRQVDGTAARQPRRVRLLGCVEWILGANARERMSLHTARVAGHPAVLATQREQQGGFGGGTAFLAMRGADLCGWTCDRGEFHAADGAWQAPEVLREACGQGLDPCGALMAQAVVPTEGALEVCWLLGYADGRDAALDLLYGALARAAATSVPERALAAWDERLQPVQVHTPDPLFDAMINRWWPYQTVSCRLWARGAFHQVSGAFGFRDQLQDAMSLAWTHPDMLRAQILLHAGRQFPEGDVQHWWHPPAGAGVRTRFSDDLLWLPFAVQHHLACTGEQALLGETVPFIEGPDVAEGAEDAYFVPAASGQAATVYEHCARAIDHALRFGQRGLPLMGGGDWNDGMNAVGREGRGESVWLGWFLLAILPAWEGLAQAQGDVVRARRWAVEREALALAMHEHAWDGRWYRRAYFDNGHVLGSAANEECRIDLIAQAWSVLSGAGEPDRARQAMASADELLVDRRHRLLRLLHPPLQRAPDHAGYIQDYPPGVRENGGQYAHAGGWAVLAQARLGDAARAWEYFCLLSAAHRAQSPDEQRRYRIEPYVMPGDVYTAPPYEGRGGWSWYTGSAGWMWRAAVEGLLGVAVRPGAVQFQPCLPPPWPMARVTLRLQGHVLEAVLHRPGWPVPAGGWVRRSGEWIDLAALPPGATVHVPCG